MTQNISHNPSQDGGTPTATRIGGKTQLQPEPIAIVGIGCRFPGAPDRDSFWQLLLTGGDAITEVPAERFDIDAVYDPDPATPGRIMTRYAGILDKVDEFDAAFFGISPREAIHVDPQQRLILEVAWEALEDAGIVPQTLEGSQTGVFIGQCSGEYEDLLLEDPERFNIYSFNGGQRSVAAGRLSFALGLQGPSFALDAACATSLVAVHLAWQSLQSGESELAIAGGVNLILNHLLSLGFSRARMLAPDGHCKTFDSRADGFVRSDGVGIVVLKPLAAAQADGNPIYAIIRGSATGNDGRTSDSMMTPSPIGQEGVLREAYRVANVNPGQVQYVEAHGTGTNVGDPVETEALAAVLAQGRPANTACLIGSVKTNIGHAETAAGIAGLIKLAMAIKHRTIPANLHYHNPNPKIPWDTIPLRVQQATTAWPQTDGPVLGGVSSFGITGSNAHIVLEGLPEPPPRNGVVPLDRPMLLPISARSPEALRTFAERYRTFLAADRADSLQDIGYTASLRRTHHPERMAVVGSTPHELVEQLESFLNDQAPEGISVGQVLSAERPKIVFVCSGQGAQWTGMARALLASEPVFRAAIEACDQAMRAYVDWSLLEVLEADPPIELDRADLIQTTIFAMEIGLAALWRHWGITPDVVVGHSMGEIVAAYLAGALNLDDATRIICRRSQLMLRTSGQGGMAVVDLSMTDAQAAIAGYEDRLAVGVNNSPRSSVISGDPEAIDIILTQLQERDIFCRRVRSDVASHSPQMDPILAELAEALAGITPQAGTIPIYSTVTNQTTDGHDLDAAHWVNNVRQAVRFGDTVQRLLADGYQLFLELSPHSVLLPAVEQSMQHMKVSGTRIPSMRRDKDGQRTMLAALGRIWAAGVPIQWDTLYHGDVRCVQVPHYPWQRERFWVETPTGGAISGRQPGAGGHPLLGLYMQSAAHTGLHSWEAEMKRTTVPYLRDHQIQDMVVVPAAAYLELALAAASAVRGAGAHVVEEMTFHRMLVLYDEDAQVIQVSLTEDGFGLAQVQIASRPNQADATAPWNVHATANVRFASDNRTNGVLQQVDPAAVQARALKQTDGEAFYQDLAERGYHYGPTFQGVATIWLGTGEALAALGLPETVRTTGKSYQVHPALLDSCFHAIVAALPQETTERAEAQTYLPVMMRQLHITGDIGAAHWSYAHIKPATNGVHDVLEGDVVLLDDAGQVVLEARGLCLQCMERADAAAETVDDWLHTIQWGPAQRPAAVPGQPGSWLLFNDTTGIAAALVEHLRDHNARVVCVTPGDTFQSGSDDTYQINPDNPEDLRQLLREAFPSSQPACQGVVHLWSIDTRLPTTDGATLPPSQQLGEDSVLHLVQTLAHAGWRDMPRLWLVTQQAQAVLPTDPATGVTQAPLWGFGRVITAEHPELHCTRIDLDQRAGADVAAALFAEIWANDKEDEVALRGDERYVARFARYIPASAEETATLPATAGKDAFRLEFTAPGRLDSLTLRAMPRPQPGHGEVEVRVQAAGLNFLDVLRALGNCPGLDSDGGPVAPGIECAGTISAVGEGVTGVTVGEHVIVMASTTNTCFSSFVVVPETSVAPMPAHLTFEEGATIPAVFMTAYYALHHLARMRAGERVLIHSATGGVGLAAVQLAQRAGAEIYATAGNPEKHAYLRSLGVEHIFNSRSLDFADEIMEQTGGQGVDIVLNSLAGAAIPRSLACLSPYGRFLEIGKRDIYGNSQLGLWPFQKNLSYFAIDLDRLARERPQMGQELMRAVGALFEDGSLQPLPHKDIRIGQAEEAFRIMAQAQHIGKLILSFGDDEVQVAPSPAQAAAFVHNGTYLITGGLGGLGLTLAHWLVARGARNLALMARRSPSTEAQAQIAALEEAGAQVYVARADVTDAGQLAGELDHIARTMPPLRGVFHAAGLLDDSTLLRMEHAQLQRAMAPKVSGTWNLHTLTRNLPLDHFVLFSSVAAQLGSSGQANYAAGNSFMDTLASYRRTQGLPALSINWGPWAEVGMAATDENRGSRLAFRGMGSLTPEQGMAAFDRVLREDLAQISVVPFNVRQWCQFYPKAADTPLLALLLKAQDDGDDAKRQTGTMRARIEAAQPEEQHELLATHVREQLAQVLRLSPDRINAQTQLSSLGLDSLLALELRNRLEASFDLTLSASMVWNYPTVIALIGHLADKIGLDRHTNGDTPAAQEEAVAFSESENETLLELLSQMQQLSNGDGDNDSAQATSSEVSSAN